jgi:CRP-like cAMP-binding protein
MEDRIGDKDIVNFIQQIFHFIPKADRYKVEAIIHPLNAEKDTEILSVGEICQNLWFTVSGAVRAFEINNGVEYTTCFFTDRSLFCDYRSLSSNKPSEYGFVAEEKSLLLTIKYAEFIAVSNCSLSHDLLLRIIAEQQLTQELESRRMIQYNDGIERYNYLLRHRPELFQRFALKHIASYIGITPVSLSRLRKIK